MKAGEKERVGALRLVLSEAPEGGQGRQPRTSWPCSGASASGGSMRPSSIRAASTAELAEHEEFEARLIEAYLPAELDDAGLNEMIATVIKELGASNVKDMGQVMKAVMARSGGRVDGKRASARVREAVGCVDRSSSTTQWPPNSPAAATRC